MRTAPDVIYRALGDEAVLVRLSTNEVFELNRTGVLIWTLLEQGQTTDQVVSALTTRFDVEAATARQAHDQLLAELQSRGLLVP